MKVYEITERKIWDKFLGNSPKGYFLQTWEWGDFEEKGLGKKIWRLGFENEEGRLIAVCLATEESGRFGKFIYCPRGPILNWSYNVERNAVLKSLVEFFQGKEYVFLRVDPAVKKDDIEILKEFASLGFRNSNTFVQVERAWMLDIYEKTEEELMLEMRKNTRYSLKKAMKGEVEVYISHDEEEFEKFLDMLHGLSNQKGFASVPKSYLRMQFKYLGDIMQFFCAKYKGEVVAGGWFAFYGEESSYLHGASSKNVGDSQAPYLIQWEAIKYAQSLGIKRHNFWGVVEDKNYHPGYPGFGYSNFKKGFGGYLEEYTRAKDFVYNMVKYQPIRLNQWYRRVRFKGN
jgi:peptidoglycan pentaglycine glycine transferase (the first glycine)